VFDSDLLAGLRAHFEATASAAEPAMACRSRDDRMLQDGVLPASLFLIGVVFGFGLLAGLASADFAGDPEMRVSAETACQSLQVQSRGALRRELTACLRTGRALRRPSRQAGQRKSARRPALS
jgi:hypothetical protein